MAKIGGFSPPEDDRINRSRRNLARQRRPRVCSSIPNLALIGKRGSIQELPKVGTQAVDHSSFLPTDDKLPQRRHDQSRMTSSLPHHPSLFPLLPSVDSIGGFAHAAGFAAARRCLRFLVVIICVFFRFREFGLETPIHAPKNCLRVLYFTP